VRSPPLLFAPSAHGGCRRVRLSTRRTRGSPLRDVWPRGPEVQLATVAGVVDCGMSHQLFEKAKTRKDGRVCGMRDGVGRKGAQRGGQLGGWVSSRRSPKSGRFNRLVDGWRAGRPFPPERDAFVDRAADRFVQLSTNTLLGRRKKECDGHSQRRTAAHGNSPA